MFKGVYTAIVTPFTKDNKIDEKVLRKLIDIQIENKISGIVPVGTTGESPTLSHEEHHRVIEIVIDQVKGRVPVIAGTGSNSTDEAIELTAHAKKAGASASLQVAPYYNKPTDEGFLRHFTAIADAVDLPMIVYNIPGRTGKNIENHVMLHLANHKNIVGVKEASGNIGQVMDLIQARPGDFCVLSGDDNLAYAMMALGAEGVVSVASNLIPAEMMKLVNLIFAGKWDEALLLHYSLLPLFKAIFIETNPIPIKAALAMKGLLQEIYRLPMCPMVQANREKLGRVLKEMGII
ncbi:MAG: 4-hydroxy-tetrahydrodipicolinate synthase [Spirochaetaceae bacterium]|nr:MAG: 4-hydroxy-tetrahydrodipicolinate synthase [Spirochaetaceae bacterium]